MGAKEQMISVLRDGDTARIRFNFNGAGVGAMSLGTPISIDGSVFRRVATALSNGTLHVVENHFSENKMVYAAWDDDANGYSANTFYLGNTPRYSRDFNGLVVHESVHAYFDLTRFSVQWVDNEAAAYIAQAYYLRNSGYSQSRIQIGSPLRVASLYVGDLTGGGDAAPLLDSIRDSLRNNPDYESYIGGSFTGDG